MRIDVHTHGLHLDPATRALIDLRLAAALGRLDAGIVRVAVYLSDDNGPRGGVDKHCRLLVVRPGGRPAVIDDRDGDLAALVSRAADRAGEAVRRAAARGRRARLRAARPSAN